MKFFTVFVVMAATAHARPNQQSPLYQQNPLLHTVGTTLKGVGNGVNGAVHGVEHALHGTVHGVNHGLHATGAGVKHAVDGLVNNLERGRLVGAVDSTVHGLGHAVGGLVDGVGQSVGHLVDGTLTGVDDALDGVLHGLDNALHLGLAQEFNGL